MGMDKLWVRFQIWNLKDAKFRIRVTSNFSVLNIEVLQYKKN